jgi:hypothetical protein
MDRKNSVTRRIEDCVLDDMNKFYSYLDIVRGNYNPKPTKREKFRAYGLMSQIQEKYPQNSTLKNKIDEAESVLRLI